MKREGEVRIPSGCAITGIHGGAIYLRCDQPPANMPEQVVVSKATKTDLKEIAVDVGAFCDIFQYDAEEILSGTFHVLRSNKLSPYRQLYTHN